MTKTFNAIPASILAIQQNPPQPMVSFHGSQKLKNFYLGRLKSHQKADEIIKGQYWEDGKGCAVGCTLHSGEHHAYQNELGLPEWLARLEDILFENLPTDKAKDFAIRFVEVIPVGVNLEVVKWRFCLFLMEENINRVKSLNISKELKSHVVSAIEQVKKLHQEAIETGQWNESAAWSARSAAWSAWSARSAAWSARSAAWSARSAAESARSARSARSAAESAWSAARSAWSAAESAAYIRYADQLLKLLSEAK